MRKTLLNQFKNPRLSEMIIVGKGDIVYAGHGAEEYGFIVGKAYEIQDIADVPGYLIMKNEHGVVDVYTTEYFQKHPPIIKAV